MEQSSVISRLHALRRTVRLRLVAYGVCASMGGVIAALLAIIAFDWLLWLPAALRIMAATLFVGWIVWAVWYWIIKPLRARLGLGEIAGKLEQHFGNLQDRLSSTVDFLEHGDAGSSRLARQVVSNTEQIVQTMPLESALSLRPLVVRAVLFALAAAALNTVLVVSPEWMRTGLDRYLLPFGDTQWPRSVSIVPLTGHETVAVGESVTVRMRIERGWHDGLRAVARLREPDDGVLALTMQRDEKADFHVTIDAVTTDLTYWFEAGDDSTRHHAFAIHVVRRPAVVEALAVVEPPPYAVNRAARVQDLADGAVEAPIGGHVTVTVRSTKAISAEERRASARARSPTPADGAGAGTGLRCDGGEMIPLVVDPADDHVASARFDVTGDRRFYIELWDDEGFENRAAARHAIVAVPDGPPIVAVLEPRAVTELTPTGSVRLLARVQDDFGIASVTLNAERLGTSETHSASLTDQLVTSTDAGGIEAIAEYSWGIESLSLSPGDILIYRVQATDNRVAPEGAGQVGRSAPMRIKIISDVEFDIRLRDDLAFLESRIREAALDQADVLDRTSELLQAEAEPAALGDAQREAAASLATRQARLVRRMRDLARRFTEVVRRMERNHAGDRDARRQIASLSESLLQIAAGPMTSASARLGDAREQADAASQREALEEATRDEQAAADRLRGLIHTMARWGNFRGVLTKTRDLLDRQGSVRERTTGFGKLTLGKSVESLTAQEAAELRRIRRRQEQLATDVDHLLERMKSLSTSMSEKDPSGTEAMGAALRAAKAHEVTRHLRDAVRAVGLNRTAAAAIEQKGTQEALKNMLSALKQRESRELEQLRKHLQRADEQVAHLIEEQQVLQAATREADLMGAQSEALDTLAQRQRRLRDNTRFVGEDLVQVPRTVPAGRLVRDAATSMGKAETELQSLDTRPAATAQDEAIRLLEDALARLEQAAREADQLALQRSLMQIHEDLEEMLNAQLPVNERIERLEAAIEARGRLGRSEAREASRLSREQGDIRRMADKILPDLERVVVYEWALKRVTKWMDTSRSRLGSRQIDDELVGMTNRIARELKKLIQAIVETRAMPLTTEFAEADGGGGSGQGQVVQSKPVPTVAELLVLKAMQRDINERTTALHQSLDLRNATEKQLRELKEVGEDQAEVRRLAERVMGRAREP